MFKELLIFSFCSNVLLWNLSKSPIEFITQTKDSELRYDLYWMLELLNFSYEIALSRRSCCDGSDIIDRCFNYKTARLCSVIQNKPDQDPSGLIFVSLTWQQSEGRCYDVGGHGAVPRALHNDNNI